MGVLRASRTFYRVIASMTLVFIGILIFLYTIKETPPDQIYTGQFFLNQSPFLVALVFSLIGTGIMLLIARHH